MEKITLKKIVFHKNKYVVIPLIAGIFMALYGICGAISYHSGVFLPIPEFEKSIPMLRWSIYIYIVLYPAYLVWCIIGYSDEDNMNKTLFAFMVLTVLSCAIFLSFPVNYPREFYPLPPFTDITTLIFKAVRMIDKPSNCLPSLHVGICFCFAFGWYRENKPKFWISIFISILISISTLTTKQHYIYDVVAGFGLAILIFYFFDKYSKVSTKV